MDEWMKGEDKKIEKEKGSEWTGSEMYKRVNKEFYLLGYNAV
jgi:hypothetical protein